MLRTYKENTQQERLYHDMYKNQFYDYVILQNKKYSNLNNIKMTIHNVLRIMNNFIDPSDKNIRTKDIY